MTMLCVAAMLLIGADKPPAPVDGFGDPAAAGCDCPHGDRALAARQPNLHHRLFSGR